MREIRTSGLMSGEGKRGWLNGLLPRPSSTLPKEKSSDGFRLSWNRAREKLLGRRDGRPDGGDAQDDKRGQQARDAAGNKS